jgi:hypothetical protein
MNPVSLLTASGISPAEVSMALGGLDLDRVTVASAPGWLTKLWGSTVSAMTLRTRIYIKPDLLENDPADLGWLIVHELVHVRQWAQLGVLRFLWRYVAGYLQGRLTGLAHPDAYRSIPIEIEARELAAQLQGPVGPV